MFRTISRFMVLVCFASSLRAEGPPDPKGNRRMPPVPPPAQVSSLSQGNTSFACELYGKLRDKPGNLFLSPYSISTALAMTYAGARGETAKQMAQVLHFDLDQAKLHAGFTDLQAKLDAVQAKKQVQLSVANSLWAQKSYPFLPAFLDLTKKHYEAGVNLVDFAAATEAARREINAWAENKTQDKIKELIKSGVLDATTRLVLCNAIYFKGDWAHQFQKDRTREAPFKLGPGKTAPVPLMTQTDRFGYGATDALQVLELPYAGGDLSMIVLLPKADDGLGKIEAEMTAPRLQAWTSTLHNREVQVFLPKFKMTCEFHLADTLAALGMPDAFSDGKADFSGMTGKKDLSISAVIHKAFVDVNEEGTEAAAATGVAMALTAMPMEPPVFRADHPFVFLIRENATGSLLFLGRVTDPRP